MLHVASGGTNTLTPQTPGTDATHLRACETQVR